MKYFLCLFLVLLLGCSDEKEPGPISLSDRETALQGIGGAVIIRSFLELQNSVNALNEFAISYQHDSTNTQKLLVLRKEWVNSAVAWKTAAIFLQGKFSADISSSNLYAQANAAVIEDIISSNVPRFDQTYMRSLAETSIGLAAIEYLIFGTNREDARLVIAAFSAKGSRRGAFLRGLCLDLKRRSDELLYQWSTGGNGYLSQFVAASGPERGSSIGVLMDNMIATIAKIKDERLGAPLGVNEGTARPALVESKYSGESTALLRAELQSVEQSFSAWRTDGIGARALYWLLDEAGAKSADMALSKALDAQFTDTFQKLELIKIPLEQAILASPQQVMALYESVGKLQNMLQNEVVAGLHFRD
jgi:uncharacterized protein